MRLTESVREKIYAMNDGFTKKTSYESKNYRYTRKYTIKDGTLIINESGNTSWSDSRYDKTWTADKDEQLRFLRLNITELMLPQR